MTYIKQKQITHEERTRLVNELADIFVESLLYECGENIIIDEKELKKLRDLKIDIPSAPTIPSLPGDEKC